MEKWGQIFDFDISIFINIICQIKRSDPFSSIRSRISGLIGDRSGLEPPEQLETPSMPPDDSFGFDDDQWLLPVAPETTKHDPEKTVFCSNLRPFLITFQDGQLLAERKVFQSEIGILLGPQKYVQNQYQQHLYHKCKLCRPVWKCQ